MNKMTVIQLLNKIANGEEVPKKIHFIYSTYQFDKIDKVYRNVNGNQQLEQDYMISKKLNNEVEILEEPKGIPEKIDKGDFLDNETLDQVDADLDFIIDKINEICDYLKSKGE